MQDVGINYFNIICVGGGEVVLKMMIVGWYGGGRLIWGHVWFYSVYILGYPFELYPTFQRSYL